MPTHFTPEDHHHMKSALALARRGLGRTAPNPSVGCVIVKDGNVIARARTGDRGRPHAEALALEQAGAAAKGATVYVTLEPCSHHGQTPPCTQALIAAGVARVVAATLDPDRRVNGQGIAQLRKAGIEAETGLLEDETAEVNRGFILTRTAGRPLVTLKIASTLDAKTADQNGKSKWITGAAARQYGHLERSMHDAVAAGIGTVMADDPQLGTRLPGVDHAPVRIVFDTNLRLPPHCRLLKDQSAGAVWVVTAVTPQDPRVRQMETLGAGFIHVEAGGDGRCDLGDALKKLAEQGITRLLIEGGPGLQGSFLKAGLFDRILWFRNTSLLGAGRDGVETLGLAGLDERMTLKRTQTRILGDDLLEIYEKPA